MSQAPNITDLHGKPFPTRKHDLRVIDAALEEFAGDRKQVAAKLGITPEQVKAAIYWDGYLRYKWSRTGMAARKKARELGVADPRQLAEIQVNEAFAVMASNANRIVKRLEALEKRIELADKARENPDDPQLRKHAFTFNEKGEPSEEALVLAEYRELIAEHRQITSSFAAGSLTAAKIADLLKKSPGMKSRAPNGRPVVGFEPKGAIAV